MSDEQANEMRRRAREKWEKIYNKARDQWKAGQVKSWDEFDDFFGIPTVDDDRIRSLLRHQYKQAINDRASRRGQNWRILMNEHGQSVVKLEDSDLVNNEGPARWKRIAEYLDHAKKVFTELLQLQGLDPVDRKLLKGSCDTFEGTRMMMRGAVSQMRGITSVVKQEILEYLDAGAEEED